MSQHNLSNSLSFLQHDFLKKTPVFCLLSTCVEKVVVKIGFVFLISLFSLFANVLNGVMLLWVRVNQINLSDTSLFHG